MRTFNRTLVTAAAFILCLAATNTTKGQFSGGDGSVGNPYIITTDSELAQLATYVNAGNTTYNNKNYKLNNNISLANYQVGYGWTPIGNGTNPFKGVFDGDSNQITNLYVSGGYVGLFGRTDTNATVKNIGLVGVNINTAQSITGYAGGLVGENKGIVSNCYSTGMLTKNMVSVSSSSTFDYTGGLVGYNYGSVLNCYSTCTITIVSSSSSSGAYAYAGGVVGSNQNSGNVSNCYSTGAVTTFPTCSTGMTGTITTRSYAGGIVGDNKGTISNCYATGAVSATSLTFAPNSPRTIYAYSRAGGIVGYNSGNSSVSNCYATGAVSATSTSSSTVVSGNKSSDTRPYSYAGGVVGHNDNSGSSVSSCAALNSKISCTSTAINGKYNTTYEYYGRVVGNNAGTLTSNIAFDNMINPSNTMYWGYIGASNLSGASYTINDINTDDTLGGRFTSPIWTTQNGKLPGLFGNTVNMPAHLYIAPTPPTITTTTLPNGMVGTVYSQTLSATGTIPITWSIESGSNLPGGLLLIGDTIYGTPNTAGTFVFSIVATNGEGSDTAQLSITIAPVPMQPSILTIALPDVLVGATYNYTLLADGDTLITWSISSGVLPTGLSLSSSGLISGTPTVVDTFPFTVTATNAVGEDSKILSITVMAEIPIITSTTLPNGVIKTAYNQQLIHAGTNAVWSTDSGSIPTGLTLAANGLISGTPTVVDTFIFIVKASNEAGEDRKTLSITVMPEIPVITTTTLPNGMVKTAYNQQLTHISTSAVWSVDSGSMPTGLTLDANGLISGIPTVVGTFTFIVKASNETGENRKGFSLTIKEEPILPTILTSTLLDGTVGTAYVATLTANGDAPITWSIESGSLPPGLTLTSSTGEISGTPTVANTFSFVIKATNNVGNDTKSLKITTSSVGIAERQRLAFLVNIYPNPAQNTLYIMSEEAVEQVNIYDISGRMLLTMGHAPLPNQSIDISHLANGIYIIKVKTAGGETVKRIMVND